MSKSYIILVSLLADLEPMGHIHFSSEAVGFPLRDEVNAEMAKWQEQRGSTAAGKYGWSLYRWMDTI